MTKIKLVDDSCEFCAVCGERAASGPHLLEWCYAEMLAACWSCAASNPKGLLVCCRNAVEEHIFNTPCTS